VSDAQSSSGTGSPPRGFSPLTNLIVAGSAAAIVLALALDGDRDGMPVWRAVGDVPAHSILTQQDVRLATDGSPGEAFVDDAIGHLTLRPLPRGAVVKSTDIGPDIPRELGRDAVVVGVETAPADAVAGALEPGDRVLVVVSPRDVEGIAMSIKAGRGRYHVAVALRRADAKSHGWFREAGPVRLVREL